MCMEPCPEEKNTVGHRSRRGEGDAEARADGPEEVDGFNDDGQPKTPEVVIAVHR